MDRRPEAESQDQNRTSPTSHPLNPPPQPVSSGADRSDTPKDREQGTRPRVRKEWAGGRSSRRHPSPGGGLRLVRTGVSSPLLLDVEVDRDRYSFLLRLVHDPHVDPDRQAVGGGAE